MGFFQSEIIDVIRYPGADASILAVASVKILYKVSILLYHEGQKWIRVWGLFLAAFILLSRNIRPSVVFSLMDPTVLFLLSVEGCHDSLFSCTKTEIFQSKNDESQIKVYMRKSHSWVV